MADVIKKATNKFTRGLVMDFSPENTRNEVLTNALNATLLTFNGNELSLLNDMGNARVETAYLPEGYIPVGTCEYGGIIYIVSYNPLEDKSLIGCFPSPERNVSSDELGVLDAVLQFNDFQQMSGTVANGNLSNTSKYVLLKNDKLNPGDKFIITANQDIYHLRLQDLLTRNSDKDPWYQVNNPMLSLNIVSIEDSGKIVYLNSDVLYYDASVKQKTEEGDNLELVDCKYYILGQNLENFLNLAPDIDNYRSVVSSGYNVFKAKTSGKLAILAELIMIDSYSVTHSIEPDSETYNKFNVIIHTDVEPTLTEENKLYVPKLRYYYLKNSLGVLSTFDNNLELQMKLYIDGSKNDDYEDITLNGDGGLYVGLPYNPANPKEPFKLELNDFDFPMPKTYHGNIERITKASEMNKAELTKFYANKMHRVTYKLLKLLVKSNNRNCSVYIYKPNESSYISLTLDDELSSDKLYYIKETKYKYIDAERKEEYEGNLYKYEGDLVPVDRSEACAAAEKFVYLTTDIYTKIEHTDISYGLELFYIENNQFVLLIAVPDENTTYYKKSTLKLLVSVGVNPNNYALSLPLYWRNNNMNYKSISEAEEDDYFDFTKYPTEYPNIYYYREPSDVYTPIDYSLALSYADSYGKTGLYYTSRYGSLSDWVNDINDYAEQIPKWEPKFEGLTNFDDYVFYIKYKEDADVSIGSFTPDLNHNYILGVNEGPENPSNFVEGYPVENYISVYKISDYLPNILYWGDDDYLKYTDVNLASLTIPKIVYNAGKDLPFKYDYTIVPCMEYGKLDHLAVSNTVDFSKLHDFQKSNFTTWKYRIDGDLLRLTFGTDIYDTFEPNKVNGLHIEFYDHRGFAGSIEVKDKKAYSGIFTKVIQLNNKDCIGKKKVYKKDNKWVVTEDYLHNVNIDGYSGELNHDENKGWTGLEKEDNDCGTLYSNLIYGVKTYIKQTIDGNEVYTEKDTFFLFTMPLYNDYYYTVDNFNFIENPELDLILTYKLEDSGYKSPYSADGIVNGYKKLYYEDVLNLYYRGLYESTDPINLIKYYQHQGTSRLYLEIGLKEDYREVGLSYDPNINKYFLCDLLLVGNSSNGAFDVSFNDTENSNSSSLNYGDSGITNSVNYIRFADGDEIGGIKTPDPCTKEIETNQGLQRHNFINFSGDPIPINYNFVVGYNISIDNITSTLVPATTVCALCHQNSNGEYNYEDFGIYIKTLDTDKYLSDIVFSNGGTYDKETFSISRLKSYTGNIEELCVALNTLDRTSESITKAGLLNVPEALKFASNYIPKLSFAIPYTFSSECTNVVNFAPTELTYSVNKIVNNGLESLLYNIPRYVPYIVTEDSYLKHTEFIVPITSSLVKENNEIFYSLLNGLSGQELELYNKCLIQSMKNIYAYNPDYDYIDVNKGTVNLLQNSPTFTSNIISSNAVLNIDDFNKYLFINGINFSTYFTNLDNYAYEKLCYVLDKTEIKPLLKFGYDLTYCGKLSYLISPLSYSIPASDELVEDLNHTNYPVIVQHEDRRRTILSGELKKPNALYGFDASYNKLVELDVSNYTINGDGELYILGKPNIKNGVAKYNVDLDKFNITDNAVTYSFDEGNLKVDYTICINNFQRDAWDSFSEVKKICSFEGKTYYVFAYNNDYEYKENKIHDFSILFDIEIKSYGYTINTVRLVDGAVVSRGIRSKGPFTTIKKQDNVYGVYLQDLSEKTLLTLLFGLKTAPLEIKDSNNNLYLKNGEYYYTVDNCTVDANYTFYVGESKQTGQKGLNVVSLDTTYYGESLLRNALSGMWHVKGGSTDAGSTLSGKLFAICFPNIEISAIKYQYDNEDILYVDNPIKNYYTTNIIQKSANSDSITKNLHEYNVNLTYTKSTFVNSTITINDLLYRPNEEHRLYIKPNRFITTDMKVCFRSSSGSDWNHNTLHLYLGPSYNTNTFNNND